jgi:hypothetical protein
VRDEDRQDGDLGAVGGGRRFVLLLIAVGVVVAGESP